MQMHGILGMKALLKQDSIPFKILKIVSLRDIILLSKVCLKPENHPSKAD
jgi:hypothetical protein